ncbi:MAG: HAD family hydrolase [Bacillota bacterium]|jgi:putative hydrolase of the HAD superfamily
MKKLLIFDLDDTLIHTHSVFLQVTAEVLDRMEELGIIDDNLYYTLDSFDQEMVETEGNFNQEVFPRAVQKTYEFYCQKLYLEYSEETAAELNEIAWQIKSIKYEIIDGAKELLDTLADKQNYTLILVTRGEEKSQKKKITDNHLQNYFQHIYVVPDKNSEVFGEIISKLGFTPQNTWIIGNSLRAEIIPAQQLEANCILTTVTEESWSFDNITNQKIECPQVSNLLDCLNIIK